MSSRASFGRAFVASAAGCAIAIAACSSFSASPTAAPTSDADAPEAGEASIIDGPETGGPSFPACAKERTVIGESFKEETFPPNGWVAGPNERGAIRREVDAALSPPGALRATATPAPPDVEAQLEHHFVGAVANVDLQYSMRIEHSPNTYSEMGCTIKLANAANDKTRIVVAADGTGLDVQALGIEHEVDFNDTDLKLFPTFEAGWYQVHMSANVEGASLSGSIDVTAPNGTKATKTFTARVPQMQSTVDVNCGIDYLEPLAADVSLMTVLVDDITIAYCPL